MSTSTTTNPASPAQLKFIKNLFEAAAQHADVPGVQEEIVPVQNLLVLAIAAANDSSVTCEVDKRGASRCLDALKRAEKLIKAHVPMDTVKFRKLDDGAWGLIGSAEVVQTGALVKVAKYNADPEEKLVGEIISTEGPNVIARIRKVSAKDTVSPLVAAFHARFGTKFVGVALAPTSASDNDLAFWFIGERFVYQVIGGQGRVYQAPKVAKAVLARLAEMSDDEVKAAMVAYGLELGHCGACGRELTNQASRERGIGPVCVLKYGFGGAAKSIPVTYRRRWSS